MPNIQTNLNPHRIQETATLQQPTIYDIVLWPFNPPKFSAQSQSKHTRSL